MKYPLRLNFSKFSKRESLVRSTTPVFASDHVTTGIRLLAQGGMVRPEQKYF